MKMMEVTLRTTQLQSRKTMLILHFNSFKQQKKCTLPDYMHTCKWMFIRQPGLGKQSQQVTSRLSGEHNDKFILFSQSCGAKLECWEINIGRFMPHACQLVR